MYEIDEPNAEKVRLIYKLYINGSTNAEIIKYLNNHGITNAKGKPFRKNGIYSILGNIRYTGTYKYDDIIIPDAIPAIIDKETFEKAQSMKNTNRTTLRRQTEQRKYPLSTKLFCGCCGRMMIGYCGTGRLGNKYYYYICPNHKKKDVNCTTKNIQAEYLEDEIYKAINEMVMTDEVIDKIAIRIDENNRRMRENSLLSSLEEQIAEVDKGIENITRAIETTGLISQALTKRLQELEEQKTNLEYSVIEEKAKAPDMTIAQIKRLLKILRDKRAAVEYNEQLVDSLVHRIYLYDDRIIIWLNYTKEPTDEETKELESVILENGSSVLSNGSPENLVTMRFAGFFFCPLKTGSTSF
ncbi:MAG: recombinase family protein [Candidatus Ornithomonoglobus sp.]